MITGTVLTSKPHLIRSFISGDERNAIDLKIKKSFLYIGNNSERTTNCFSFFDYGFVSPDYEEAKSVLIELYENGILPDFIIVDKPLDEHEIFHFVLWLHSNKWSFMIPVLYNESILNEDELALLKKLNVADDVINVERFCNNLLPDNSGVPGSRIFHSYAQIEEKNEEVFDHRIKTSLGKRIFDIVIASAMLVILSPLLLLISIIIKLESKGPVIYKSKRAGRGFRVFDFYKFRTMVQDADSRMEEYIALNLY
ncbi:MAG TPA: sugar transferase, partial [Saprospiraceae bacterium]|nr:sugar transferase [Saprospiraceae bacterium]